MAYDAEVYSCGVDWLTATTKSALAAKAAYVEFVQWSQHMIALGHREEVMHWQGYEGIRCAHVAFGQREDSWCTVASSWQAAIWYRTVMQFEWKPTRMDVQVTARFPMDREAFAVEEARHALEERDSGRNGRPYRLRLIEGFGSGDTLEVGSRSSARFGRLYDKWRESKGEYPSGAWRWEVEYKKDAAIALHEALWPVDDETPIIAGIIREYFEGRGVRFPVNVQANPVVLHLGGNETSDEKSLRWLAKHVRPTVDRLKLAGKETQAREALGLLDSANGCKI